jgi:hypothetical protein
MAVSGEPRLSGSGESQRQARGADVGKLLQNEQESTLTTAPPSAGTGIGNGLNASHRILQIELIFD